MDLAGATDPPGDLFGDALHAADAVHSVRDDAPTLRVEVDPSLTDPGEYLGKKDGTPLRAAVHPQATRPRLTFLHEIGHYIDHAVFAPPGVWSSPTTDFDAWRAAVDNSVAVGQLRELKANPPMIELTRAFDYYLRIEECFARSYAEWVTVRSESNPLYDDLTDALAKLNYPYFWGFEDFGPIADELDKAFEEYGWKL
jgi:hypothetical protein